MSKNYAEAIRLARAAPLGAGRIDYLINRPAEGVHTPVDALYLDPEIGIQGDRWRETAWLRLPDGPPDPQVQVSLTNTRVMQCFAGSEPGAVFRCGCVASFVGSCDPVKSESATSWKLSQAANKQPHYVFSWLGVR